MALTLLISSSRGCPVSASATSQIRTLPSTSPEASRSPAGEKATALIGLLASRMTVVGSRSPCGCQSRTLPSSLPEASRRGSPVGENATAITEVSGPSRITGSRPPARSHIPTPPYCSPKARRSPSGENVIDVTASVPTSRAIVSRSSARSQIRTRPWSPPRAKDVAPGGVGDGRGRRGAVAGDRRRGPAADAGDPHAAVVGARRHLRAVGGDGDRAHRGVTVVGERLAMCGLRCPRSARCHRTPR